MPPGWQPHSASKNHLRVPRFITNPPVTLKAPLNLNRADPADYVRLPRLFSLPSSLFSVLSLLFPSTPSRRSSDSAFISAFPQSLVERKILRTLGVPALPEWTIAAPRRRFTPRTRAGKDAMIREEVERMKAYARATGGLVDSMHIDGPVPYQVVVASG